MVQVVTYCLVRKRQALSQIETSSVDERFHNLAGALNCLDSRLKGRHILLIDDVATSEATLDAEAAKLKEGRTASAWGLALAHDI